MELETKYSGDEKIPIHLGRSSTYDTSETLKKEISAIYKEEPDAYEMEVIN